MGPLTLPHLERFKGTMKSLELVTDLEPWRSGAIGFNEYI